VAERSPKQLRDENAPRASIGRIAYHVNVLVDAGLLRLVETKQRRGSLEHVYAIETCAADELERAIVALAPAAAAAGHVELQGRA
jgi:hypothetical protein